MNARSLTLACACLAACASTPVAPIISGAPTCEPTPVDCADCEELTPLAEAVTLAPEASGVVQAWRFEALDLRVRCDAEEHGEDPVETSSARRSFSAQRPEPL